MNETERKIITMLHERGEFIHSLIEKNNGVLKAQFSAVLFEIVQIIENIKLKNYEQDK